MPSEWQGRSHTNRDPKIIPSSQALHCIRLLNRPCYKFEISNVVLLSACCRFPLLESQCKSVKALFEAEYVSDGYLKDPPFLLMTPLCHFCRKYQNIEVLDAVTLIVTALAP